MADLGEIAGGIIGGAIGTAAGGAIGGAPGAAIGGGIGAAQGASLGGMVGSLLPGMPDPSQAAAALKDESTYRAAKEILMTNPHGAQIAVDAVGDLGGWVEDKVSKFHPWTAAGAAIYHWDLPAVPNILYSEHKTYQDYLDSLEAKKEARKISAAEAAKKESQILAEKETREKFKEYEQAKITEDIGILGLKTDIAREKLNQERLATTYGAFAVGNPQKYGVYEAGKTYKGGSSSYGTDLGPSPAIDYGGYSYFNSPGTNPQKPEYHVGPKRKHTIAQSGRPIYGEEREEYIEDIKEKRHARKKKLAMAEESHKASMSEREANAKIKLKSFEGKADKAIRDPNNKKAVSAAVEALDSYVENIMSGGGRTQSDSDYYINKWKDTIDKSRNMLFKLKTIPREERTAQDKAAIASLHESITRLKRKVRDAGGHVSRKALPPGETRETRRARKAVNREKKRVVAREKARDKARQERERVKQEKEELAKKDLKASLAKIEEEEAKEREMARTKSTPTTSVSLTEQIMESRFWKKASKENVQRWKLASYEHHESYKRFRKLLREDKKLQAKWDRLANR